MNPWVNGLATVPESPPWGHWLEAGLGQVAGLLKVALECLAVALIFYAVLITLQKYVRHCRRHFDTVQRLLRLALGRYLSLSRELLLAADIVGTAVSPTWDAIAKLAAISAIRTFLNDFLEREVTQLERQAAYPDKLPMPAGGG